MLNQLLGGRYRVLQALGEGGLAKTYIAEDHHRPGHPKCAVKFLKLASHEPDFLPTARRLFKKEAEILEKLGHHDQIPQSFAYFEENQEFYLVQEFIEGHTLRTELPRGQRWFESQVIQMLQDVLQILEFVHSFGVIHRDINPNNLIRRQKDNRLVLIDFGAVKQVRTPNIATQELVTQKTISIGTKGYMPTEQVRGKPRFSSDIYALGMIAIQAITGLHPINFQEDSEGEIIWQECAKVSDELAAILTKMVRYHFQDRYQSVSEVLQALQLLPHNFNLFQATLDDRQIRLEVDLETKLQETNFYPNINDLDPDPWTPWNPDALTQADQEETKIAPEVEESTSEVVPEPKKVFKLVFPKDSEESTSEVVPEPKKAFKLVFPEDSLAPPKDLELSPTPIVMYLNKFKLFIGAGLASVLVGIFAGYSYMTHRQHSLQVKVALEKIEALKSAKKYQECLLQAETFTQNHSDLYAQVENFLHECQQGQNKGKLDRAIELATQSNFKEAIALATQVPVANNNHLEAQKLISQWSERIFQTASSKYEEGNLEEAVGILLSDIPDDSPMTTKVKMTITQWNDEWEQNKTHLQEAQQAIDENRWQDAINAAQKISNNNYWQKQSEPIIQKAEAEIASAQTTSQKAYQPNSRSVPRSSPNYTRSRSLPPSRSNASSSRSLPPSQSTAPRSRSVPRPTIINPRPKSNPWICLNNPNPKCRR
ncbi:MAG: serine/threonine-protein kinase [Xenococcaceae cyanobacterium MO_188.B29]|nr:serine/threonine-protein kinase [Xenococcaceae cyanobacterium MO_188.B29]